MCAAISISVVALISPVGKFGCRFFDGGFTLQSYRFVNLCTTEKSWEYKFVTAIERYADFDCHFRRIGENHCRVDPHCRRRKSDHSEFSHDGLLTLCGCRARGIAATDPFSGCHRGRVAECIRTAKSNGTMSRKTEAVLSTRIRQWSFRGVLYVLA